MMWQGGDYYRDADHASVLVSVVTALVVGELVLPGLVVYALCQWQRARHLAKEAKRASAAGLVPKLASGHVIVHGKVVGPADAGPVARLLVEQHGEPWRDSDGELQHRWEEVHRTVDARPFDLSLPSGETLHVVADRGALVDRPFVTRDEAGDRRTRAAALSPGDETFVEGELVTYARGAGGYRSAPAQFTLVGSGRQPLVLSAKAPVERHERRAAVETSAACLLAIVAILVHSVSLGTFWGATLFGKVEEAPVRMALRWTVTHDDHAREHFGVIVAMPSEGGVQRRVEVGEELYDFAQTQKAGALPTVLPIVRPPFGQAWFVGPKPSLSNPACGVLWLIAIAVTGLYLFASRTVGGWHPRGKLHEVASRPLL
jgi:hypothetical protein